jgi:hypothetical protein
VTLLIVPLFRAVGIAIRGIVPIVVGTPGRLARHEVHPAPGAGARLVACDFGMHGAGVLRLQPDLFHIKAGSLRRERALREEPPQLTDAGGQLLLTRCHGQVGLRKRRDVSRSDGQDCSRSGHLSVGDRRSFFQSGRWLANQYEYGGVPRALRDAKSGCVKVETAGAGDVGSRDDERGQVTRHRQRRDPPQKGGTGLPGAEERGAHCRLSAPWLHP